MSIFIEKRTGKRVDASINDEKVEFNFLGEEQKKSLKTVLFEKLFRPLEEGESEEQLTEEEQQQFVAAKNAAKETKSAENKEKRAAEVEAKKKEREARKAALIDENLVASCKTGFNTRGGISIAVEVFHKDNPEEKFVFDSEISVAGKVAFAWLYDKTGAAVLTNKGAAVCAAFVAEKTNLKEEVLAHAFKELRLTAIQNCKITPEEVAAEKARIKAAKPAPVKKVKEETVSEAPALTCEALPCEPSDNNSPAE